MTSDLEEIIRAALGTLEKEAIEALVLDLIDRDTIWAPRALAGETAAYHRELTSWVERYEPGRPLPRRRHPSHAANVLFLLRGGIADRPPRRMPSITRIADHHDLPGDECWRCRREGPVERAHIVDRMVWAEGAGLDAVQNLALLCPACHRKMPIIEPDHWEKGLAYVGLARRD